MEKKMRAVGEGKIHPILMFPPPKTLKQLRAFFGGHRIL
jgi:hypothetical protein